jgi:hypothetical protein
MFRPWEFSFSQCQTNSKAEESDCGLFDILSTADYDESNAPYKPFESATVRSCGANDRLVD